MNTVTAEELLSHYQHFARSPLLTEDAIRQDFYRLVSNPRVTSVGFVDDDAVLIVGTDDIVIEYQGAFYVIGQFQIFIVRDQDIEGYWQYAFRFWNHTKPLIIRHDLINNSEGQDYFETLHPHPHMLLVNDDLLPFPNAKLCISQGHIPVLHDIQRGNIAQAISTLIEILEVYPTGVPYKEVELWGSDQSVVHPQIQGGFSNG